MATAAKRTVDVGQLREQLDDLVERAEAGEAVEIRRGGKTVAWLGPVPSEPVSKPTGDYDWSRLDALWKDMPMQEEGAGEFMRRLRDDARY